MIILSQCFSIAVIIIFIILVELIILKRGYVLDHPPTDGDCLVLSVQQVCTECNRCCLLPTILANRTKRNTRTTHFITHTHTHYRDKLSVCVADGRFLVCKADNRPGVQLLYKILFISAKSTLCAALRNVSTYTRLLINTFRLSIAEGEQQIENANSFVDNNGFWINVLPGWGRGICTHPKFAK